MQGTKGRHDFAHSLGSSGPFAPETLPLGSTHPTPGMAEIRPFSSEHIGAARSLWERTEGVGLSIADEPPALARYLERNPGLSFVAMSGSAVVGAALCGHDGRRGYLHHLAVEAECRRRGIGAELISRCLSALGAAGIEKCHIFVYRENLAGQSFWSRAGWIVREDLVLMSAAVLVPASSRLTPFAGDVGPA